MSRRRRPDLEQGILQTIYEFVHETGYPPTYREVSDRVHSAHSNVWQTIQHLREGGFLRETPPGAARALILSPLGLQRIGARGNAPQSQTA